MTARPLNFASAQERQDWLIQNADYFTTARFINRKLERQEHKSFARVCKFARKARRITTASSPFYSMRSVTSQTCLWKW